MQITDKIRKAKLSDLKPYPNNVKVHTPEQIKKIRASIERNQYIQPISVDSDNVIVIGHGRYAAMMEIDPEMEIEVVDVGYLGAEEIRKLRILDNKINESEWDYKNLEEELKNIYSGLENELADISDQIALDIGFPAEVIQDMFYKQQSVINVPNVNIQGQVDNKSEHLIIQFDEPEECNAIREKLNIPGNGRVVAWGKLKEAFLVPGIQNTEE